MSTAPDHQQLYEIAEEQAGYFTAGQARRAGFGHSLLTYHVQSGRFLRTHRGVYRLTQFPGSPHEDLFVAWLRAGPDAVISHQSALVLFELSDVLPAATHVIVPRTASRRRRGLRQHTNRLAPSDITRRNGLPVTTPARTIADVMASGVSEELIGQAVEEALARGLTTREELLAHAERRGGRVRDVIERLMAEPS